MKNLLLSEIAFQNDLSDDRKLIAIQGKIYDVSDFLSVHPGGDGTIRTLLGRDATVEYNGIHGQDDHRVFFKRMCCGAVIIPVFDSESFHLKWKDLSAALDESVAMINIFSLETEVFSKNCFRIERDDWSAFKENMLLEFSGRFQSAYIPHLVKSAHGFMPKDLRSRLSGSPLMVSAVDEKTCTDYLNLLRELLMENLMCMHAEIRRLEDFAIGFAQG
ncbi:MAG: cytochrome b5-like heme/steroid binding domain-containing protein [Flavobacteriia bacterium]|jgi:predicted heme/steroid binding protein